MVEPDHATPRSGANAAGLKKKLTFGYQMTVSRLKALGRAEDEQRPKT
jgi:hypothetical protein